MPDVESHVVEVYTHAIFYRVRKQILREGKYGVTSITLSSGMILLRLKKYGDNVTKQSVLYDGVEDTYTCECQCYPIKGIPCRYIFACMKHMGVTKILVSLIWKHWTQEPRVNFDQQMASVLTCQFSGFEETGCFSHIHALATNIAYYVTKSEGLFNKSAEKSKHRIVS